MHASAIRRYRRLQPGLALIRLGLLYISLCFTLLFLGLVLRAHGETDPGLAEQLPPASAAGMNIPRTGVTVELEQYADPARRAALQRLEEQGIGWVRQRLDWCQIETIKGQFNWDPVDSIVNAVAGSALTPIVVLDGSPSWARDATDRTPDDNPLAPPADPADFARFAGAVAERYGETLTYYQIWDEPNIAPHWGNRHIDPVGYALLLKSAAEAIRAHDPDAIIIMGALAPTGDRGHTAIDEVYFLQRVYAAGGANAFDVVALQPFGFGYRPEHTRRDLAILNFGRMALVRHAMIAAGDAETPIWATRFGWNRYPNSPWLSVSPENQMAYASRALSLAQARWPWLATLGWAIDQPAMPADNPIWGFALVDPLLDAIEQRSADGANTQVTEMRFFLTLLGLLLIIVLLIWRAWQAAGLLPLSTWLARYRRAPPVIHLAAWFGLALIYYFAIWPPLIGLCWIGASLLFIANPSPGLWLAAVLLPFHIYHKEIALVDTIWIVPPAHALLICSLPALMAIGWNRLRASPTTGPRSALGCLHFLDWMALAWLGISLGTRLNVWHLPGHYGGLMDLVIMPLLLYTLVRMLVHAPLDRQILLAALFSGGLLVALLGIGRWFDDQGTMADGLLRLVGPHFSPNHTALYLIRTLFIGLGLLPIASHLSSNGRSRTSARWAYPALVTAIVVVLGALALTASRGAWLLGIPAGVVLLWALNYGQSPDARSGFLRHPRRIAAPLALPILFGAGLSLLLFWTRLSNSETLLRRLGIWSATLRLWRDFPLLGVGPGGFFWTYPAYLQPGSPLDPNLRHPHNLWLEYGALWGVAGLIWLGAILFYIWREAIVHQRFGASPALAGVLAGLIAGLAHAQVDAFGGLPDLAAWNWLALGVIGGVAARNSNVKPCTDPSR